MGIERSIQNLNALPTSGSLVRSLFYAFMSREGIYTCVFSAVPAFVAEHGRGSFRHPSLCSGSPSPGRDTSFELTFKALVAFRLDFRADIILHFIFIACVELFYSVRRFQLLWHLSPSRWFFSACVALQLAISGVSRFHYSFMVSFVFCSPLCAPSVCRL